MYFQEVQAVLVGTVRIRAAAEAADSCWIVKDHQLETVLYQKVGRAGADSALVDVPGEENLLKAAPTSGQVGEEPLDSFMWSGTLLVFCTIYFFKVLNYIKLLG